MTQSKKHHIVPQSILKNFSYQNNQKQIYVYDKSNSKSYLTSILNAGSENHFNTIKTSEFELNFEAFFNENDAFLARIVSKIINDESIKNLTIEDQKILIKCIAYQLMRTKLYRTTMISTQQQLKEEVEKQGWSSENIYVPTEEVAKLTSFMHLSDLNETINILLSKNLRLFKTNEKKLWISDNPITIHNSLPYGDIGIDERGTEMFFPISNNFTLCLFCPSHTESLKSSLPVLPSEDISSLLFSLTVPMKNGNVNFLNCLQIFSSHRFLYSSENNFAIATEILNKYPKYREVKSSIQLGEMGKGPPRKKNMPKGDYLVVYGSKLNHMIKINIEESHITAKFTTEDVTGMAKLMDDQPFQRARIFSDGMLTKHLGEPNIRRTITDTIHYELGYKDESIEKLMKTIIKKKKNTQ